MSEATAEQPALEPVRTLEQWIAVQCDLLARNLEATEKVERAVKAQMTQQDCTELVMAVRDQRDIKGVMLDVDRHIAQAAVMRTFEEALERGRELTRQAELAAVPEPAPRQARHRAPRDRADRPLRSVRGLAPLGVLGAAARPAWLTTHHVVAGTIATAAVAAAATTVAVVPHVAATFGLGGTSATAPSTGITSAVPVTGPSQIAAVTRPGGAKGTGRILTVLGPSSMPSYTPPAYAPPAGDGQDPAAQQQSQDPAPQARLVVTGSLDLGTGTSGTIRVTAFGGPADWSASASTPGLGLDATSGTLPQGHTAVVTVSLAAELQAQPGPGQVTITYGDGKTAVIPVSWTVVPLPVPSQADTTLPTDMPSPPTP